MDFSHETSDLQSFKDHGENVTGSRSSVVLAEVSVSDFCSKQENRESNMKVSPMTQHDDLENFLELAENPSEDSMRQIISDTGKLDLKSSPDGVGQSVYDHDISSSADSGDGLLKCEGEPNTRNGDPAHLISRTNGSDSSLTVDNDEGNTTLDPHIGTMNINGALSPQNIVVDSNGDSGSRNCEEGKYFYYETPLCEDTGAWIPVSVPPMRGKENFYSLHSWLGLLSLFLFGIQWTLGFLTFYYPGGSRNGRASLLPWHGYLGHYIYGLSVITCVTGFLGRATSLQTHGTISRYSTEAILINSMGVLTVVLAGFVIFGVQSRVQKR